MTTTASRATLTESPPAVVQSRRRPFNPRRAAAWALLVLAIAVSVLPFLWCADGVVHQQRPTATPPQPCPRNSPSALSKRVFGLQSPAEAVAEGGSGAAIDFWVYLRNSVVFSSITTAGAVFFSAMAAYAFARLRWRDATPSSASSSAPCWSRRSSRRCPTSC